MTILLVEDNALIAMTLEATLTEAGYKVAGPAASAKRAIEFAEAAPPHVALLNIRLSDGGSGVDLARTLKQRWGTAVIFLTGDMIDEPQDRAVAIGVLSKPCTDEALLSAVDFARQTVKGETRDTMTTVPKGLTIF